MSSNQTEPRWRFLITPKWLSWHLLMIVAVLGMLALGDWQLHRAESGNALSWAYTFEWPLFAGFALVFWAKTIRDEFRPPGTAANGDAVKLPSGVAPAPGVPAPGVPGGAAGGGQAPGEDGQDEDGQDDEELNAYNAYLARLTKEVKGHGKWHGLR